jgi:hypothetical protein
MPINWEALVVAQAIFHGPVRFHLRTLCIDYRLPSGRAMPVSCPYLFPSHRVRAPPLGLGRLLARSTLRLVGLRSFAHGLGSILVLRAPRPVDAVRGYPSLWRFHPGLMGYYEIQDRCGRVVLVGGAGLWSADPIRCYIRCLPVPAGGGRRRPPLASAWRAC